jgi:hypothetical protein
MSDTFDVLMAESDAPKPGAGGKVTLWTNDISYFRHGHRAQQRPGRRPRHHGYCQGGRVRPQAARHGDKQTLHQRAAHHAVAAGVAGWVLAAGRVRRARRLR